MGRRKAAWRLAVLFRVAVSKSAIDRGIDEIAPRLSMTAEMIQLFNQAKPISEGHLDKIFLTGSNSCVLLLKDEHSRITTAQEVAARDEAHVPPLWGGSRGGELIICDP